MSFVNQGQLGRRTMQNKCTSGASGLFYFFCSLNGFGFLSLYLKSGIQCCDFWRFVALFCVFGVFLRVKDVEQRKTKKPCCVNPPINREHPYNPIQEGEVNKSNFQWIHCLFNAELNSWLVMKVRKLKMSNHWESELPVNRFSSNFPTGWRQNQIPTKVLS